MEVEYAGTITKYYSVPEPWCYNFLALRILVHQRYSSLFLQALQNFSQNNYAIIILAFCQILSYKLLELKQVQEQQFLLNVFFFLALVVLGPWRKDCL